MASPIERLIAMRHELDSLIAELNGGAPIAPAAPKKTRGRPKVAKADLDAAAAAGGVAAEEIERAVAARPKRLLSDEQKAKMKAGREAAKARRELEAAAAGGAPALGPAAAGDGTASD